MHAVQDSICASYLETQQVQVGPGHLPGEKEVPGNFRMHSHSSRTQQAAQWGFPPIRGFFVFSLRDTRGSGAQHD